MLKELSKEQTDKFPEYVEKYISIGLDTSRMDKQAAVAAVKKAYEIAGLELPENVIFCKGLLDANEKIKEDSNGEFNVLDSFYPGLFNAGLIAYFDFFRKECQLEGLEKVEGLHEMTLHCGWVNLFDTHVYISEKPLYIKMDDQNRGHCEDGPAYAYEDGLEIYMWHGISVPKEWIVDGISAQEALREANIEKRRAACEIVGWDRILDELDCEIIEEDGDPEIGTLVSVEIPDIGRENYLRVQCGTGRSFAIPVPPECKTALEANAWTYGLEPWEYKPEVRT